MPITYRDTISPNNLPYEADAVVYREGDYAVAKIRGRRGELSSTDHAKLFQEVVDYVNNFGGGRIYIARGTYYVRSVRQVSYLNPDMFGYHYAAIELYNANNVEIIANYAEIVPDFTPPDNAKVIHFVICGKCKNVKISGIKVRGDTLPSPYPFDGYRGISIHGCENVKISDNVIELTDTNAISTAIAIVSFDPVGDVRNVWVKNNILYSYIGDTIGGGANPPYIVENLFVENNIIIQLSDYPRNAFDLVKLTNVIISRNEIYGLLTLGVEQVPHRYNIISENIVRPSPNGTKTNISISSTSTNVSSDIVIVNNVIEKGYIGIGGYSKRINVVGNVIVGGINEHLITLDTNVEKVLIANNLIYMPQNHEAGGIVAPDVPVHDIEIHGNMIFTENEHTAIYMYSGSVRILNNRIQGSYNYGIRLYYNVNAEISNNIIIGNGNNTGISIEGTSSARLMFNEFSNLATPVYKSTSAIVIARGNKGYTTENGGIATFTGDGTTTQFKIAHGLVDTPRIVIVTPKGSTPKPDSIDWDGTYIYINYSTAPASGTVLTFSWYAEV